MIKLLIEQLGKNQSLEHMKPGQSKDQKLARSQTRVRQGICLSGNRNEGEEKPLNIYLELSIILLKLESRRVI